MFKITSKHLFFLITGVAVVAIKTYPNVFTKSAGRDSWICQLIAGALIIIYFLYLLWICKKKNIYDIVQIYQKALGRWIGGFFVFLFAVNLFLNLMESAGVEASAMHTNFLSYTPIWGFLLLTIPAGIYVVERGYAAVLTSAIIAMIAVSISGCILFVLTWKYKDYHRLLPILEHGLDFNFYLSVVKLFGAYASVGIILPYLSDIKEKSNVSKYSVLALVFVVQIETVANIGTLTTFEVGRVNAMFYPKLIQTQIISHFGFLEAGELFVMLQLIAGWFLKYVITLFALTKILEKFKMNKPLILYSLSVVLYFCTYFASRNIFVMFQLLNYLMYINLINYVMIPFLIFTIFLLRKTECNKRSI